MRLIDADKLMCHLSDWALHNYATEIRECMDAVEEQPTVDPVKHGWWIHEVDTGADMLKCSECSCRVVLYWYKLAVGTAGYEYCPYCGAKMDEEG